MKRWIILSVVTAIILCVTSIIGWMVGTSKGNHFVLTAIIRFIPAKINIGRVTGTLTDNLRIDSIKVHFKGWEIRVKTMQVSLQPAYLTAGVVVFKKAVFQDVSIVDHNPDALVDIVWPKVPGWLSLVNGRIKMLSFDRIVFYSKDKEKSKTGMFQGEVLWRFGTLTVKDAAIGLPIGRLEGSASAGFVRPALSANVKLIAQESVGTVESLLVNMKLKTAQNHEYVSGPITVTAMSGSKDLLYLKGDIAITNNTIKFKDMLLTEKGRQGEAHIDGMLDFASNESIFDLQLKLSNINLSKELNIKTSFSGNMHVKGNPRHYKGGIYIRNADNTWRNINLNSAFEGDSGQIQLKEISGVFLDGTLEGFLQMSWIRGFYLTGGLKGRDLNPSKITPEWKGKVNADSSGAFRWEGKKPVEGALKAELLKSILRNKALVGRVDANWRNGILHLDALHLRGDGFDLSASGILEERLNYEARISDLAGLIPDSKGRFSARGWARWQKGKLAGILKGNGYSISSGKARIGSAGIEAELDGNRENSISARIKANNLSYGDVKTGSLGINVNGKVHQHTIQIISIWQDNNVQASLAGGYMNDAWEGTITQLAGVDAHYGPFSLASSCPLKIGAGHFSIGALSLTGSALTGSASEKLDAEVSLNFEPLRGYVRTKWQNLNLSRINPLLNKLNVSGNFSGSFEGEWLQNSKVKMAGNATMNGNLTSGPLAIRIAKADASLKWDEKGLTSLFDAGFDGGGSIRTRFTSNQPARSEMPDSGELSGTWQNIDISILKPWLPESIDTKGQLSGTLSGKLMPGSRFETTGELKISNGRFLWKRKEGLITVSTEKVDLNFVWKESALKGNLVFVLPGYGHVKGMFQLPVQARLPAKIEPDGPMRFESSGRIREKGVVSAIFPGLIEETQGQISFNVAASGTWQTPDYKGWLRLEKAGAFLPTAGIHIKDMGMEAELAKDHINITSFQAYSGQGNIQGSATIWLKDSKIVRYKGMLNGKRFQAIYVPEIQVWANPDLNFEGDTKRVLLRGSIEVPEALVRYGEGREVKRTSPDIIIVDAAPQKVKHPLPFDFDTQISVSLGNKVQIRGPGIEIQLDGKVLLTGQNIDRIIGDGQIRIVKGHYNAYGAKLDVTRGSIVFGGGPVELASLDIMALRKINPGRFDEIKAGITVTGTPKSPLIKLYSEPSMPEQDILSYIVLGRPLKVEGETNQTSLLLQGAGAFLVGNKVGSAQNQLMHRIGIDTLGVETKTIGGTSTGGTTGTGLAGSTGSIWTGAAGSSTGSSTMTKSLATVGKYIAPGLYVAYGRSLFTDEYLFTARYSFSKSLEVESKTGIQTGVDLYYKFEFD